MDEATASCDPDTDSLIQVKCLAPYTPCPSLECVYEPLIIPQRTVRQHFRDVTILTVAHRLPTIIDYDKVLVMNAGVVAEYDTPHALLHRPGGIFNDMVESTGPESASFLRSAAERAASESHTRTLTHL